MQAAGEGVEVVDHRPHLMMPGFIDTHIHMPQAQVIASWGAQLLDWLNTYTFPEETRFSDPAHAARIAGAFLDLLLAHGTTTAVAYCSSHPTSVDAYFTAAEARGLRMIGGKVMMDRNCPTGVRDTAQASYDDSKALIARWHGKGRALYAISPRFAITSTPGQMEMAQALVAEHPDLHMQTHLSENRDEIDLTLSLYPEARDYLDVYERYGLLGPKSLFGHAIHLSDRETAAMAESGSVAVFCPTSNLFLGSGLYDKVGLREKGVRRAIATDVGGGTNYSMLGRSTRATRCWRSADRSSTRCARSGGSPGGMPRRSGWSTRSARWSRGRRRTSSCSTARRRRPWRSGWRRSGRWSRSSSCCRCWATTGR